MIEEFKNLIEDSHRILITSHISPDPDAVSSLLLLGTTLKLNYPDKQITMVLEEKPTGLNFINGFDEISFQPVFKILSEVKPDLFVLIDGNNFERCSRHDGQKIRNYIKETDLKTVIIDHHELAGKDDVDIFINNDSPATAQDVYEICFNHLAIKPPPQAAQTAMTGFYADTGGFIYVKAGGQDKMFDFAKQLIKAGADVESIKYQLENYSEADLLVIGELSNNISHQDSYSYSFLDDAFIEKWSAAGKTTIDLQRPTNAFLNDYIRNIEDRHWGFIIYKNLLQGDNFYSVSLRSQGGQPDVSIIATALGGGGHKPAAGAKFEANNLDEAINKVKRTISGAVTGT